MTAPKSQSLANLVVASERGQTKLLEQQTQRLEILLAPFAQWIHDPKDQALASHLRAGLSTLDWSQWDEARVEVLLLSWQCGRGNEAAIQAFEQRYFGAVVPALRRMRMEAAQIDEVLQVLRIRVLVASEEGELAKVVHLAGKGDMRALLRVSATRIALNLMRDGRRLSSDPDAILTVLTTSSDPQLAVLKERYSNEVKEALELSLAKLSARERTLLRLHLAHRLSVDEIGAMFQVHRATAARWLARVRTTLEQGTRQELQERLGVEPQELASIIRCVQSQIDISFDRLLASGL